MDECQALNVCLCWVARTAVHGPVGLRCVCVPVCPMHRRKRNKTLRRRRKKRHLWPQQLTYMKMFFTGALIKCEIFLTNFIIIVDFIYDYLEVFVAGVAAAVVVVVFDQPDRFELQDIT